MQSDESTIMDTNHLWQYKLCVQHTPHLHWHAVTNALLESLTELCVANSLVLRAALSHCQYEHTHLFHYTHTSICILYSIGCLCDQGIDNSHNNYGVCSGTYLLSPMRRLPVYVRTRHVYYCECLRSGKNHYRTHSVPCRA